MTADIATARGVHCTASRRSLRLCALTQVASVALLLLGGCASNHEPAIKMHGAMYPPAPHVARVQHLASFSGSDAFDQPRRSGILESLFGGAPAPRRSLYKPYGVAALDGKLLVCDSVGGNVYAFDFAGNRFDRWNESEEDLIKPITVHVDPGGDVLVCDVGMDAVVRFDATGRRLGAVNRATMMEMTPSASVPEDFRPVGVVKLGVSAGASHAVLNAAAHRIELIDMASGRHAGHWSGPGIDAGLLRSPTAIATDDRGEVWVADRMNHRMVVFDTSGNSRGGFGDAGDQPGYCAQLRSAVIDDAGIVYTVDAGLPGVQLFDRDGTFLMGFGYPSDQPAMGLPAGICLDKTCLPYFADRVDPSFQPEYLIFTTDQMGPYRLHVFAFGKGAARQAVAGADAQAQASHADTGR